MTSLSGLTTVLSNAPITDRHVDTRIATNERLLLIIEALSEAGKPLTPTELNAKIGLPKQSVHRLCNTLIDLGYLQRSAERKRLEPTARLLRIGAGLIAVGSVDIARHQILSRIATTVREAVNYVVPEREGMVYLDRIDTDWPFRMQLPVGTHVPFHCTASGKTYLASLPLRQRRTLVDALDLVSRARNTIVDRKTLQEELTTIAAQGYAIDNQEFMDDLVAIAVPVVGDDGRFLAALAFHGPAQRVTRESALARLQLLREGATQLGTLLRPTSEEC
tara:strand:- start:1535 stop:2365 length:831 start_codon:yes stop_codon:yes gene_type:complete